MSQTQFCLEKGFSSTTHIGTGDYKVVAGWCFHPDKRVVQILVVVGDQSFPVADIGDMRTDIALTYGQSDHRGYSVSAGFWGLVPLSSEWAGTRQLLFAEIHFADGTTERVDLGDTQFVSVSDVPKVALPIEVAGRADLVICLATYNPRLAAFKKQIDSIIAQTHRDWICIVNDDCSNPEIYEGIRQICDRDPRFIVRRNPVNLGFYRNFEAALMAAPQSARLIALADQDDYWYPEKLEKCLRAFDANTQLVYSDMRIVKADGTRIADTYWVKRRNNYQDFAGLLLANTVTGAASVFRADLLPALLPFPDPTRESYHDHWIACVALAKGKITYVDEPLYDYIQHGHNVIGHADDQALTTKRKIRFAADMLVSLLNPWRLKQKGATYRHNGLTIYHMHYRQRQVIAATLRRRLTQPRTEAMAALRAFDRSRISPLRLLAIHFRLVRQEPTASELALWLALSRLVKDANDLYVHGFRRHLISRFKASVTAPASLPSAVPAAQFLRQKMAPLSLAIDTDAPQRVNILIAEINAAHFFGGYMGMFNFAKRLAETGHRVRLITVDPCDYQIDVWRRFSKEYEGLENIFDLVEVECHYERNRELVVHPADSVVATSVWTAHIAHAMVNDLGHQKFVFFAQEYEPFFQPMGSLYALSEQAYTFPHHALFSTAILADFFRQQQIGVYSDSLAQLGCKATYFHNAILRFSPDAIRMVRPGKRKLLFYCRPEGHAARNLFEIGYTALNDAIRTGVLDPDQWEYYGIGSAHSDIPLCRGQSLKMLGKKGLKDYQALLPDFDIGMSLMYTPHPSLVPLEMAAAGLITVTNTCLNKTAERIAAISSNLIAAEPSILGVLAALSEAATRATDYDARVAGSQVNWPSDWRATFNDAIMNTLACWLADNASASQIQHIEVPTAAPRLSVQVADAEKVM